MKAQINFFKIAAFSQNRPSMAGSEMFDKELATGTELKWTGKNGTLLPKSDNWECPKKFDKCAKNLFPSISFGHLLCLSTAVDEPTKPFQLCTLGAQPIQK
jgi:hypothetical protein